MLFATMFFFLNLEFNSPNPIIDVHLFYVYRGTRYVLLITMDIMDMTFSYSFYTQKIYSVCTCICIYKKNIFSCV